MIELVRYIVLHITGGLFSYTLLYLYSRVKWRTVWRRPSMFCEVTLWARVLA